MFPSTETLIDAGAGVDMGGKNLFGSSCETPALSTFGSSCENLGKLHSPFQMARQKVK